MTWVTRETVRFRAGEHLFAEAKSVLLGYDYGEGRSVPLTDEQRRRLSG